MIRAWRSIRLRLALASAAAAGVIGASIGAAGYLEVSTRLVEIDLELARHQALELAHIVAGSAMAENVRRRLRGTQQPFPAQGVDLVEVYDLDLRLVGRLPADGPATRWREGLERARAGDPATRVFSHDGHDEVEATLLARFEGQPRWVVMVRVDRAGSKAAVGDFRRRLLGWVPAAVLLMFFGAFGLVAFTLRPVHDLVADARRIAGEGLGRRLVRPPRGSLELAELVRLLNELLARAEQTVERKRRFAADASHELRTPLTRMRGEAEVALHDGSPAAATRALLSVTEEVDTLRRLVDGLLELSRGETTDLGGSQAFDLAALATELGDEARAVGEARGVAVEVDAAPAPAPVRGSRDLLGRALWNLLDNALKYAPAGERVRLSLRAAPGGARVVVEDTGPGVPVEFRARLFEPFFRADPARTAREGHGLGLALARTIARRSGGDLTYEPVEPHGARFTLTLPPA